MCALGGKRGGKPPPENGQLHTFPGKGLESLSLSFFKKNQLGTPESLGTNAPTLGGLPASPHPEAAPGQSVPLGASDRAGYRLSQSASPAGRPLTYLHREDQ